MTDATPPTFCLLQENLNTFPCNVTSSTAVSMGVLSAVIGIIAAMCLNRKVKKYDMGNNNNETMKHIATQIQIGARTFLRTEYRYMSVFVITMSLVWLILYSIHPPTGNKFDGIKYASGVLGGGILSTMAGWDGMAVATNANVRTTIAAQNSGLAAALDVCFSGGAAMGFHVAALGLFGISVFVFLFGLGHDDKNRFVFAAETLSSFGLGASSIALFARVAGGIYTKAADIGADLVGKLEQDLPEDDPRNPAVIADNVGDNVGDVAGMGADLLESYVGGMIAAMTLANGDAALIMLPIWISGAGMIASVAGYFVVRVKEQETSSTTQSALLTALTKGQVVASTLTLLLSAIVIVILFPNNTDAGWRLYGCLVLGMLAGVMVGQSTEYFTSYAHAPTRTIANAGQTGPGTVVIQGLGIGMLSTAGPVVILTATILACHALSDNYGVSISSVGMLSTLGITLATDAFGPIADNAGGICQMAGCEARVRNITDALDAIGNTTAATGKGFAIGSAVLTAISLLAAFRTKAKLDVSTLHLGEPVVLTGLLLGAMLPFLFASLTMLSVQKAASAMILEVRRQFAEIPGLRQGTAAADSSTCIGIAAQCSVEEMILPGLYAVLSPVAIAFLIGPSAVTGLLGGAVASGMMLALTMANAGGAWDNAKKYIEIENVHGGKHGDSHKACVVGDTVGDPFKDTSGPSLNILIKLMSIVSLTIAPMLENHEDWSRWYLGLIPLMMLLIGTCVIYELFWKRTRVYHVTSGLAMESHQTLLSQTATEQEMVSSAGFTTPSTEMGLTTPSTEMGLTTSGLTSSTSLQQPSTEPGENVPEVV